MKEGNHQFGNLRVVAFESKVSAGNEVYFGIGQVAFEGSKTYFLCITFTISPTNMVCMPVPFDSMDRAVLSRRSRTKGSA